VGGVKIAVVGGGVAGMCAAWRAQTQGAEVVLLEASSRLGGQILTEHVSGCVLEHGAEGFVAHSEALNQVCRRFDLASDVISQTTTRALLAEGGVLRELPPGEAGRLLGIQARTVDWGRGLQSLRRGMGSLVEAMAAAIGQEQIRLSTPVEAVEPAEDGPSGGWRIHLDSAPSIEADGVIVALPGAAAGVVLREVDPRAAGRLRRLETVSSLSVTLVVARDSVRHPLDATGLVVGDTVAPEGLRACSFASSKFAGRAPSNRHVIRAFYRPPADGVEDQQSWIQRTQHFLERAIGLTGDAELARVVSWPAAIPRYASDHEATLAAVLESLQRRGRIALAGASVARSGLAGAVRSGYAAAEDVLRSKSSVTVR
jgi:oxygen-dependent protoporphyrinogen oxidase